MEQLLNGRYRLGPKIGDGGMAVVYRGYDNALGRNVAIKVLREQYAADPAFVARFEREAQAVAALVHPNIINIFDVGHDFGAAGDRAGRRYFVMEYIDGPNLKDYLRAHNPLPIDEIVAILTQALAGLGYAHARGLVHRDVKPQNIMLTRDGIVKVTDFGIAKGLADATLTAVGVGLGTVHYASPEQARGEPATPASDLYAVGVILYEMLVGALPFTADSAVGVAMKHVNESPVPPQRLNRAAPAQLSALTMHALAKDPRARFQNAKEMAVALNNWRSYRVAAGANVAARSGVRAGGTQVVAAQRASTTRDGVGWLTWALGIFVLVGLLVLLYAGYRLSPFGAEGADAGQVPPVAGLPTEPPVALPTATSTAGPQESPSPSATVALTPTRPATPATSTPTVGPTQTPTAAPVAVPNLVGKTLSQAQAAAQEAGLVVEQVEARFSDQPADQIVEQRPAAGTQVAKGTTIVVVVSRGPQTIQVPDVKNQPYASAAQRLEALGLKVTRRDVPSRNVTKGIVIDQEPLGGNTVRPGATVALTVSLGDVVEIPDLFGQPFEQARSQLERLGLHVNVDGQDRQRIELENPNFFKIYPNVRDGQVISQTIPAGTFVERGSSITIAYYKAKK